MALLPQYFSIGRYLAEERILEAEVDQSHISNFVDQYSKQENTPDYYQKLSSVSSPQNKYDENVDGKSEDLGTEQENFSGFPGLHQQANSTNELNFSQRPRTESVGSLSTTATSKYDHISAVLRLDQTKYSFYGSPEREASPPISELPSPAETYDRSAVRSFDEGDEDGFLIESERSALEMLEWSHGLNAFRKATPPLSMDVSTQPANFRFVHPIGKQLFPPSVVPALLQPSSTSPIRAPIFGNKVLHLSPQHSPNRAAMSTIQEVPAYLTEQVEELSHPSELPAVSIEEVADPLPPEIVTHNGEELTRLTPSVHGLAFPEVVYETVQDRAVESELSDQDSASVGSSLSAASIGSYPRIFSTAASTDLIRRQLLRKQKIAKKKKAAAAKQRLTHTNILAASPLLEAEREVHSTALVSQERNHGWVDHKAGRCSQCRYWAHSWLLVLKKTNRQTPLYCHNTAEQESAEQESAEQESAEQESAEQESAEQ
jgi:hypothetical protein